MEFGRRVKYARLHLCGRYFYCPGAPIEEVRFLDMNNYSYHVLQDVSYLCCIELKGDKSSVISGLSRSMLPESLATLTHPQVLDGRQWMTFMFFQPGRLVTEFFSFTLLGTRGKLIALCHTWGYRIMYIHFLFSNFLCFFYEAVNNFSRVCERRKIRVNKSKVMAFHPSKVLCNVG